LFPSFPVSAFVSFLFPPHDNNYYYTKLVDGASAVFLTLSYNGTVYFYTNPKFEELFTTAEQLLAMSDDGYISPYLSWSK